MPSWRAAATTVPGPMSPTMGVGTTTGLGVPAMTAMGGALSGGWLPPSVGMATAWPAEAIAPVRARAATRRREVRELWAVRAMVSSLRGVGMTMDTHSPDPPAPSVRPATAPVSGR